MSQDEPAGRVRSSKSAPPENRRQQILARDEIIKRLSRRNCFPAHVCRSDIPNATRCDICLGELVKAAPQPTRRLRVLQTTSSERKQMPLFSGLLAYFPDALAMVARISYLGNQKHNPGEELHWARGKSMDHADCVARHLIEHGTDDVDGNSHSAQMCWRALALYQQELEKKLGLPIPRGAREPK